MFNTHSNLRIYGLLPVKLKLHQLHAFNKHASEIQKGRSKSKTEDSQQMNANGCIYSVCSGTHIKYSLSAHWLFRDGVAFLFFNNVEILYKYWVNEGQVNQATWLSPSILAQRVVLLKHLLWWQKDILLYIFILCVCVFDNTVVILQSGSGVLDVKFHCNVKGYISHFC